MPLPKPKLLAGWRRAKLIALINESYLSFRVAAPVGLWSTRLRCPQIHRLDLFVTRWPSTRDAQRNQNSEPKLRPPAVSKSLTRSSCGIAGTSPSEDRPARHRVAQTRVLGVAAWRTGPLQHGARTDDCRRGRQAAEPRARLPGGRTHADCEPDKVYPGQAGHSQFQTDLAEGVRTSGNCAYPGRHAAAAKYFSGAAAGYGAAGLCYEPDQGDRGSSSETIGAAP